MQGQSDSRGGTWRCRGPVWLAGVLSAALGSSRLWLCPPGPCSLPCRLLTLRPLSGLALHGGTSRAALDCHLVNRAYVSISSEHLRPPILPPCHHLDSSKALDFQQVTPSGVHFYQPETHRVTADSFLSVSPPLPGASLCLTDYSFRTCLGSFSFLHPLYLSALGHCHGLLSCSPCIRSVATPPSAPHVVLTDLIVALPCLKTSTAGHCL